MTTLITPDNADWVLPTPSLVTRFYGMLEYKNRIGFRYVIAYNPDYTGQLFWMLPEDIIS